VPTAYLDVAPYRSGAPGSYRYSLGVSPRGCSNANRVRVTVAGRSKLLRCGFMTMFGPLAPQRTHRVTAVALKLRGGKVVRRKRMRSNDVYLPGEDGTWVPLTRPSANDGAESGGVAWPG
jgi:hypothetical protein